MPGPATRPAPPPRVLLLTATGDLAGTGWDDDPDDPQVLALDGTGRRSAGPGGEARLVARAARLARRLRVPPRPLWRWLRAGGPTGGP
ncbi:hypothetical protein, partial [Phycicoccus flavus]